MFSVRTVVMLVLFGGIALATGAHAEETMIIRYNIYDKPGDPSGEVLLRAIVTLAEFDKDEGKTGWSILELELREPGALGDLVWSKTLPFVDTPDGLWWIEHADPDDPQLEEFDKLPPINGTALSEETPPIKNMEFEMTGRPYTPGGGGAPYKPTFGMTYAFTYSGDDDPVVSGTDEPVEPEPVPPPS